MTNFEEGLLSYIKALEEEINAGNCHATGYAQGLEHALAMFRFSRERGILLRDLKRIAQDELRKESSK